jgi:hypothetical protein
MSTINAARRLWLAWLVLLFVVVASVVAVVKTHNDAGTKVLGEKITGSGSSSQSAGAGNGNGNSGCGNGNGGGNGCSNNGNGNGNKTFTITGGTDGLYPGGTVHLQLRVSNPQNQAMTVRSLSAQLDTIVSATSVTCTTTVTIGPWTGGAPFTLGASAQNVPVPGYIPVSIAHSTPDSCQGAIFNFIYSGTATQK